MWNEIKNLVLGIVTFGGMLTIILFPAYLIEETKYAWVGVIIYSFLLALGCWFLGKLIRDLR